MSGHTPACSLPGVGCACTSQTVGRAALRALADAATPGPWKAEATHPFMPGAQVRLYGPEWEPIAIEKVHGQYVSATTDARFIVAAREAVPALLDMIDAVLALHEKDPILYGFPRRCMGCGEVYPCRTRKALGGVS